MSTEYTNVPRGETEPSGAFARCDCGTCVDMRAAYAARQATEAQGTVAQTATMQSIFSAEYAASLTAPSIGAALVSQMAQFATLTNAGPLIIRPSVYAQEAALITRDAPQEQPVVLSDRERRLQIFAARGITPIPDDECTDKGSYVIWNKYDPSCHVIVMAPDRIGSNYSPIESEIRCYGPGGKDRILNRKLRAHPTKPVRIVGLYALAGNTNGFRCYYVDNSGRQRVAAASSGSSNWRGDTETYAVDHEGAVVRAIRPSELPALLRAGRMSNMAEHLTNRGAISHIAYQRHHDLITALFAARGPERTVNLRGVRLFHELYASCKAVLKKIGALVRDQDAETQDMIDALDDLPDSLRLRLQVNIVNAWNNHNSDFYRDNLEVAGCGHVTEQGSVEQVRGGRTVCSSCFEDNYVHVEDTAQYDHRDNVYVHDDDLYYSYPQADDDDYDGDEDDEDDNSVGGLVRSYSLNVLEMIQADSSVVVSTYGEFLMGIELEVVPTGRRNDPVHDTQKKLCNGYAIMKNDGSLDRGGFEIVTAPRKLSEHITRFKDWAPHKELRAWDAGCCGMHVHISSGAFTAVTLGKFIEFINAKENDDMIESIAGRHARKDSQCNQYCQREGSVIAANPKANLDRKSESRYHMVNTCNNTRSSLDRLGMKNHDSGRGINTIELRIFRATLKKSRLLAQIEFAHAAVMFCRFASMRELRQEHFITWLRKSAGMYPHLAKWFGVKANTQAVIAAPAVREEAEV